MTSAGIKALKVHHPNFCIVYGKALESHSHLFCNSMLHRTLVAFICNVMLRIGFIPLICQDFIFSEILWIR